MHITPDTNESTIVADEIGEIPAPVGATAGAIHARITIERDRLKGEEAIEAQLTIDRKRLLVEGTDADIDDTERRIDSSRSVQVRILERVDLLRGQLIAANDAAETERLNDVAARGIRAKMYGEELIGEYASLATSMATVLERLAAVDSLIDDANYILDRSKREDRVSSPNRIRCRPFRRWKETVRKMVGASEPGHPFYGKPYRRAVNAEVVYLGSESLPLFVEAELEEERYEVGENPSPLYESLNLPGVDPVTGKPFWHDKMQASPAVIAEVRERIYRQSQSAEPAKRGTKKTATNTDQTPE